MAGQPSHRPPKSRCQFARARDWDINASDLRELVHQRLVRPTTGDGYELMNEGRVVYQQFISPPAEPRRVGFELGAARSELP
jgi:hypothetical protein